MSTIGNKIFIKVESSKEQQVSIQFMQITLYLTFNVVFIQENIKN